MTLNWLQSLVYGLVAGLADILPISSRAHKILLLKLFGITGGTELMDLMIHLGLVHQLPEHPDPLQPCPGSGAGSQTQEKAAFGRAEPDGSQLAQNHAGACDSGADPVPQGAAH